MCGAQNTILNCNATKEVKTKQLSTKHYFFTNEYNFTTTDHFTGGTVFTRF